MTLILVGRWLHKHGRFTRCIVEYLQTLTEGLAGVARAEDFDLGPNLDSSLVPVKRVPIEVNRDHLAEWDGERLLRPGDYDAVGVDEPPVYDEAAYFADVGEGEARGLAKSDADGKVFRPDDGLSPGCAEGE